MHHSRRGLRGGRYSRKPLTPGGGCSIYAPDTRSVMYEHTPEEMWQMIQTPLLTRLTNSLKVIGRYSHGLDGELLFDDSSLRFIRPQFLPKEEDNFHLKVNFDLKVNQESTTPYTGTDRKYFLNLLRWIIMHYKQEANQGEISDQSDSEEEEEEEKEYAAPNNRFDADFVCVRNAISKIVTTPFQYPMEYVIYATRFQGTIYLMKERTEEEDSVAMSGPQINLSDWGHKFSDYMTKGKNPKDGTTVNNHYRAVIQTLIGRHKVLFSAKVDVADETRFDENDDNLNAFYALKCVILPTTEKSKLNFIRNKMLFQYTDMLLSGAPRCITGYRNSDAVIEDLKLLTRDELFQKTGGQWNPDTCIDFTNTFLTFLKSKITEDGEVWKIEKPSKSRCITLMKLNERNADNFLPEWYTDEMTG